MSSRFCSTHPPRIIFFVGNVEKKGAGGPATTSGRPPSKILGEFSSRLRLKSIHKAHPHKTKGYELTKQSSESKNIIVACSRRKHSRAFTRAIIKRMMLEQKSRKAARQPSCERRKSLRRTAALRCLPVHTIGRRNIDALGTDAPFVQRGRRFNAAGMSRPVPTQAFLDGIPGGGFCRTSMAEARRQAQEEQQYCPSPYIHRAVSFCHGARCFFCLLEVCLSFCQADASGQSRWNHCQAYSGN